MEINNTGFTESTFSKASNLAVLQIVHKSSIDSDYAVAVLQTGQFSRAAQLQGSDQVTLLTLLHSEEEAIAMTLSLSQRNDMWFWPSHYPC